MAAKALLKAATEAFEAGDYKGVLTLVPSDDDRPYPLLVCRGMAALQLKEWKVAEGAFRRGTELQPDLPKAWKGLADVYEGMSKPVEALEAYRALHRIAESKGNAGKAVEWLVWVAWCQDRAKQSSEARDTLKKALLDDSSSPQVAPAAVRVVGLVRLLDLEERRLRLQPERRGELLGLYLSLLEAVEAATEGQQQGEGEDEDGGAAGQQQSMREEALAWLGKLPELAMDQGVAAAKGPEAKAEAWRQAVEVGRRVAGLCPEGAWSALEVVVWGWACGGQGEEAEAVRAAKTLADRQPQAAAGNALVGCKLLSHGHVQQARKFLEAAAKGGRVAPSAKVEGGALAAMGSSSSSDSRPPCPSCLSLSCLVDLHALRTRFAGTDRAGFSALLARCEEALRQDEALWGLPSVVDAKALVRLGKARFLEWGKQWAEALQAYEAVGGLEGAVGRARVLTAMGAEAEEVIAALQGAGGRSSSSSSSAEAKALEGWARWRAGQQQALALLEEAASQDAKQGYYLGLVYGAMGGGEERDKALATLLRTAQADPTHGPTFTALGNWYRDSSAAGGDGAAAGEDAAGKAMRCYRRALELEATDQQAGHALTQLLLQQQLPPEDTHAEARRVWGAASSANAAAGWAWRWTGWEHLGRGQALEAVTCFQYAVRAEEEDAAAWVGLARAYHRLEMEAAALRAMERAVQLGGAGKGELGLMQLASGLVEEAVVSMQQQQQDDNNKGGQQQDVLVLKGLAGAALMQACSRLAEGFNGRALQALDMGIRAAADVAKAVAGTPGHEQQQQQSWSCVWKLLGDLQTMKGLTGLHHDSTTTATGLDGAMAYQRAAEAAAGQGPSAEALAWVDVGVELYVKSRTARERGGEAYPEAAALMGRARQALERALRTDPLCCPAWSLLGLVDERPLVRQHCLVRAIQLEGDVPAWANLGVLYASKGRKELAREAYRGLQLVQDHPLMWVGLALLYEEEQDWATARDAYRAALEVGAHPSAQLGLAVCNVSDQGPSKGGDPGEALAHSLMLVAQRPCHALGLNLAGMLLLDLAGQAAAAEQMLERSLAQEAQLEEGQARAVVQHNLARARAAMGRDPEPPGMLQGFLLAKSLSVRGEWSGVSALASQQLSASSMHPTLQTRWRALAALAEWQQGQGQAAMQWLAPMLPLQPEHWPQQLYVGLHALLCSLGQPQQAAALPSSSPASLGLALTLCGPHPLQTLTSHDDEEAQDHPHTAAAAVSEALLRLVAASGEEEEGRVEAHGQALSAYRSAVGRLRPCSPGASEHEAADWLAPAAAAWGAEALGLEESASDVDGGEAEHAWSCGRRQLLKALHLHPHLRPAWRALGHALVCWEGGRGAQLGTHMIRAASSAQEEGEQGRENDARALAVLLGEGVAGLSVLDRARAEVSAGRGSAAKALYKQALAEAPGLVDGWRELAELYDGEGRYQAAQRCLEVALSASPLLLPAPTRCAVWCRLAELHYRRGDAAKAMAAVGEACKARPKAAVPLLLRGLVWRLEGPGREKQAQDNFKKAQEQQPHNPWIKRLASEAASPSDAS